MDHSAGFKTRPAHTQTAPAPPARKTAAHATCPAAANAYLRLCVQRDDLPPAAVREESATSARCPWCEASIKFLPESLIAVVTFWLLNKEIKISLKMFSVFGSKRSYLRLLWKYKTYICDTIKATVIQCSEIQNIKLRFFELNCVFHWVLWFVFTKWLDRQLDLNSTARSVVQPPSLCIWFH